MDGCLATPASFPVLFDTRWVTLCLATWTLTSLGLGNLGLDRRDSSQLVRVCAFLLVLITLDGHLCTPAAFLSTPAAFQVQFPCV